MTISPRARNALKRSRRDALVGVVASLVAALAMPASAQDYPSRPVTIVVPLAAGTGMDIITRVYAEELQKSLGKPVVIENQAGAAMMLGPRAVAKAQPDGHTLLVSSAPGMSINPALYKAPGYDPEKDFAPIALYAKSPFLLVASAERGVTSARTLFAAAQTATKPFTYGTPGAGTIQHLTMEFLKRRFNGQFDHVPYRNTNQIVTDLAGGHLDTSISETGAALSLIKDGKITALAVTSATRNPQLPHVPTLAEAWDMAGFEAVSWHVLMAPAGTPPPIVERLATEMQRITAAPDFQKRLTDTGLIPIPALTGSALNGYLAGERKRWGEVLQNLGPSGTL